jgi:hypothetical protein
MTREPRSSRPARAWTDSSPAPCRITVEQPPDEVSRRDFQAASVSSRPAVSGARPAFRGCCANASRNAATTRTTSSFARRLGWAPKAPSLAEWTSPNLEQDKAVMDRKDPMGVIRDPADNDIHVIPAWEYDVTEDEFKKSMAETTVSSSSH